MQVTPGAGKQDPVAVHPADSAKPQRSPVAQSASVAHGPEPLPVSLAPELLVDPELLLDDPPLDPELPSERLAAAASPTSNAAPEQPLPKNAAHTTASTPFHPDRAPTDMLFIGIPPLSDTPGACLSRSRANAAPVVFRRSVRQVVPRAPLPIMLHEGLAALGLPASPPSNPPTEAVLIALRYALSCSPLADRGCRRHCVGRLFVWGGWLDTRHPGRWFVLRRFVLWRLILRRRSGRRRGRGVLGMRQGADVLRRDDGRREHVREFFELHLRARAVRLRPDRLHRYLRDAAAERQGRARLHVIRMRRVHD